MKGKPINSMNQNYVKLKSVFLSQMESLTLKVGSMSLPEVFQFIIAEKCNAHIIFDNVTRTYAYANK